MHQDNEHNEREALVDPSVPRLARALARGVVPPDGVFDRLLPLDLHTASSQFWTPLRVAVVVARWLDESGCKTVVDVGSGVGKFCIATALAGKASFTGIEQRTRLVEVARGLVETFRLGDRVRIVHGIFDTRSELLADAYYLYNPFGENVFPREYHLSEDAELSPERYQRDIEATGVLLKRAPVGTRVITYNGFGGDFPPGYALERCADTLPNHLAMWKRIA